MITISMMGFEPIKNESQFTKNKKKMRRKILLTKIFLNDKIIYKKLYDMNVFEVKLCLKKVNML